MASQIGGAEVLAVLILIEEVLIYLLRTQLRVSITTVTDTHYPLSSKDPDVGVVCDRSVSQVVHVQLKIMLHYLINSHEIPLTNAH